MLQSPPKTQPRTNDVVLYLAAAIWLTSWTIGRLTLEAAILLFGTLVIVPLARRAIRADQHSKVAALDRWIDRLQLPAAALVAVSLVAFERGTIAGLLATPWLVVTLLIALTGGLRFLTRPQAWLADFGILAASLMIPVGGFWVIATRFGWRPGEFGDVIVLLSGVHFHYAAFALPVLSNLFARASRDRFATLAMTGATVGVPLVGLGINASPLLEIVAVVVLVLSCVAVAVQAIRWGMKQSSPRVRFLSMIAALSLVSGMLLAGVFGAAEYLGATWISIPAMIATHGIANAFGFTLGGLLAVELANGETGSSGCWSP